MPTFTLTNKAIVDLKDIGRYTLEHWGREQRNLYLGIFHSCLCNAYCEGLVPFQGMQIFPFLGPHKLQEILAVYFPHFFSRLPQTTGPGLTRLVFGRVVTLVGNFVGLALLKASFCH